MDLTPANREGPKTTRFCRSAANRASAALDPKRALASADRDDGPCALPSLRELPGGRAQRPHSNALWAPFDNTESGLGGDEGHVVGNYGLGEALEGERANPFGGDASL